MTFSLKVLNQSLVVASLIYAAQLHAADTLTIVDEGQHPVANATVMLGYEPGNPFQGNVFTTDGQGTAQLPADWKDALPLTVQAPGFISKTFPDSNPGVQTLEIQHQEPQTAMEVKGTSTNWGRLVTDGKVDFGLVIPAISRAQMLSFDISSVISPQTDRIKVITENVDIPSNITLPDQRESYIVPIELNKPDYRVYLRSPGQYQMAITHGQFPLRRVVDDIRAGKSFLEVVNYFDFKEAGVRSVDVNGNLSGVDLPVNQTPFTGSFAVQAPTLSGDQVMMSLGLVDSNGLYLPTDVKRFTSGQSLNLKTTTGGQASALSLLMENTSSVMDRATAALRRWFSPLAIMPRTQPKDSQLNIGKMSFTLTSAEGGAAPQFLPLIAPPALDGQVLKFDVPQMPAGLSEAGMYLTLSEIETINKVERRTRVWEIMSAAWVPQLELPKIDINRRADRKYRWEVLFMARPNSFIGDSARMPRVDLNTVTHATRNSLDI